MVPSFRRFFLRLVALFRGGRAEAELSREIASHLQMLEDAFIAQGMSAEEARFAARRAFGGVAEAKERQRETRTFAWLASSWLDLKLGLRMLAKYPWLSLVSVTGMAVAIALASGYFGVLSVFLDSSLPFPEGDRILAIRHRAVAGPDAGDTSQVSARDFLQWRGELATVGELGAFTDLARNLLLPGRRAELVTVAAMTASGFRLTRVAPMLGRPILDEDEHPGAPPVLVLGHDEWQRLFGGNDRVVGQTVRLDETPHTIVGVMPPGFAFPVRHRLWVPLRPSSTDTTPSLHVFGRLVAGSSIEDARAELASIGDRMAAASPRTHANLRPQALAYPRAFIGIEGPELEIAFRALQLGTALLLLIVAANVAILVYARTATRMGEIAVRTALGASRARIVAQLFIEALVLSLAAAGIALLLLSVALDVGHDYAATSTDPSDEWPFWIQMDFSAGVFLHAALLAVLAAFIIGALPALKATGKRVQRSLQQLSSSGARMTLGRTWSALIVVQVAIAAAALPAAMHIAMGSVPAGLRDPAPAAAELLKASLATSRDDATFTRQMTALLQRLREEPEIAAVTFAQSFPGLDRYATVEVEGDEALVFGAVTNRVAENLFTVFDVPLLAGRRFRPGDERPGATAVIVDETFAERLGGGHALGRRVRTATLDADGETRRSEWFEIVGVVPAFASDFTAVNDFQRRAPRIFHAAAIGAFNPATLVVRVRAAAPPAVAPKLIDLAAGIDPALRLERVVGVVQAWEHEQRSMKLLAGAVIAIVTSVLLLSAAGIYAMMSFTVASRRREIGIRAALGADPRRVLLGVFGRAAAQLGLGVAAGVTVAALLDWAAGGELMGGRPLLLLPPVAVLMSAVGFLAALGPARRSLAIPPAEALRAE
jgi:predicted permease